MKKILTLTAALMLVASAAMAASGLNLYLNDCSGGSTLNHYTWTCNSNSGTAMAMIGSVVLPEGATVTNFIGYACIIDIQTMQSTIPDWWRGDACRGSAFAFTTSSANMPSTCGSVWDFVGALNVGDNFNMYYGGMAPYNYARERVLGASVIPAQGLNLVGDGATEYDAFKFTVSKVKSVGLGACAGCSYGACIVLNEINFEPLVGESESWLRVTNQLANDYIVYNTSYPTCNGSTPTQNRTWGSVKALYR